MTNYNELVKAAIRKAYDDAAAAQQKNTTFEVGAKYSMNSACDHNCVWTYEIVKRTKATVTIRDEYGKETRCKIHTEYSESEYIYPLGKYSMCPILRAERKAA